MVDGKNTEDRREKKEKNIIICLEQFRKNLLTTKSRELRSVFPKDKLQDNITKFIYLVRNKDNVLC